MALNTCIFQLYIIHDGAAGARDEHFFTTDFPDIFFSVIIFEEKKSNFRKKMSQIAWWNICCASNFGYENTLRRF